MRLRWETLVKRKGEPEREREAHEDTQTHTQRRWKRVRFPLVASLERTCAASSFSRNRVGALLPLLMLPYRAGGPLGDISTTLLRAVP